MRSLSITVLLVACLALGTACADGGETFQRPDAQLPIRSLAFLVDPTSRTQFLGRIETIAKQYGLEYRATQVTPDAISWIAEMASTDFRVIVANDLKPEQYDLRVYESGTLRAPATRLTKFLDDVQSAVRVVPGVTVLGPADAARISN